MLLKNRKDSVPDPKKKHNMDLDPGSSKVPEPELELEPVFASFGSGSN
jgi:hypothetical protein